MARFDAAAEDFAWLLRHVSPPREGGEFDAATISQVLDEAARFIGDVIAPLNTPHAAPELANGRVIAAPGWKDAYAAWRAAGWQALGAPAESGGMGAPFAVQAAVSAMLGGADISFAMLLGGGRAGATLVEAHGSDEQKAQWLPHLVSGELQATIVVTEAQAGTDVGLIATKARPLGGGRFALSGTKIFISNGDHDLTGNILHIVLARIDGAQAGARGLSLFLVPMRTEDGSANGVWVSALEEKLGLHASPTCVLNFDRAEGTLVGAEGGGLAALFTMMNEMRLDVGLMATGLMQSATAHARAYAQERVQGQGRRIAGHPDVRRMLSIMAARTQAARALAIETARQIDLAAHGDATTSPGAARLAAFLTPVVKAGLSEAANEVASLGVQVFGGHGYVVETGAEQFLRDARVLALYEGANGVQAIDLTVRKLQKDGGAALADFAAAVRADLARLEGRGEVAAIHDAVRAALSELQGVAEDLLAAEEGGPGALAAAWPFLELAGHVCFVWMWLRMAGADLPQDDPVLARKRVLAAFAAGYDGPRAAMLAARARAALATPALYEGGA